MSERKRKPRHSRNIRMDAIRATWSAIEDSEPNISTERLISMTADQAGVEIDDVIAAMEPSP